MAPELRVLAGLGPTSRALRDHVRTPNAVLFNLFLTIFCPHPSVCNGPVQVPLDQKGSPERSRALSNLAAFFSQGTPTRELTPGREGQGGLGAEQ